MKWQILALIAFLALSVVAGLLLSRVSPSALAPPNSAPPQLGGIYSVDNADGGYRVVRVFGVRPHEVRVTLYGNHFSRRPEQIELEELSLQPSGGYEGPGFADLTVSLKAFRLWKPSLIRVETLSTEQLSDAHRWEALSVPDVEPSPRDARRITPKHP
jgi:hypothetical protein